MTKPKAKKWPLKGGGFVMVTAEEMARLERVTKAMERRRPRGTTCDFCGVPFVGYHSCEPMNRWSQDVQMGRRRR